jgi:YHS domain-containing protein
LSTTVAAGADRNLRTRDDMEMTETRKIDPNEDPVCGMVVDPEVARAKGLTLIHDGREYRFCGKGCFLEFRDNPEPFLDPRRLPAM